MRRANGTGSIVYLGKKRRRPYAIRISTDVHKVMTDKGMRYRQTYKYLAYFATAREAQNYLDALNAGKPVPTPELVANAPTFEQVFERWLAQKTSLRHPPSAMTIRSYKTAFNRFDEIKSMRFDMIRHDDLQQIFTAAASMSHSTVNHMLIIVRAMYKYALANDLVLKDYSKDLVVENEGSTGPQHQAFSDREIAYLWTRDEDIAKVALILIHTGMRVSEWTQMLREDVHLDQRYMIGGVKTAAGKRRLIPIHEAIVPLVQHFLDKSTGKLIFPNRAGHVYDSSAIYAMWRPVIPERRTHDCRHTFATRAEAAGIPLLHRKLILGHQVTDLTEGKYTHVDPAVLIADVNHIIF